MHKVQYQQTAAYYLAFFGFGLLLASAGPALPHFALHTGTAIDQVARIFIFSSIGFMSGSLLSGLLYDRFPGGIIMSLNWFAVAVLIWFIPAAKSLILLQFLYLALGFTNSSIVLGCNTLITRIERSKAQKLLNGMHVVNGAGAFLSPLIITLVILATDDILFGFRLYAVLSILFGFVVLITPSPVQKENGASPDPAFMAAEADGLTLGSTVEKAVIKKRFSKRGILITVSLMAMIYVGTEITFSNWIFTYIVPEHIEIINYIVIIKGEKKERSFFSFLSNLV